MFARIKKTIVGAGLIAMSMVAMPDLSAQADAGNRTTILVMAEDSHWDSIPRDARIVERIQDAMNNQMNQMGFDVFDESAVTYSTTDANIRRKFPRGGLIDIARHNVTRPGSNRAITIRAVATFETFLVKRELPYTNQVRMRISGRLIDPQSGRSMGNFEVLDPAGGIRLHPDCQSTTCIQESVGDNGRELGEALGYELARLLDVDRGGDGEGASTTNKVGGEEAYSIVFRNLSDREFARFEEYLVEYFSGYIDHDIDKSLGKTHYVTYRSIIKASKLKRNLARVFDEMDWKGRVTNSGHEYTVEKLSTRNKKASDGKEDW